MVVGENGGREGKEREKKKKKETIRSQRHDFLGMSNYRGSMLNKGPCETMAGVDGSIDRSIQFRLNIFHWWRVINARGQRDKISRLRTRKLAPENSHREFPRNNFPLPLFKATVSREERNYRPSVRISISTRVLVFAQSSVLDALSWMD